MTDVTTSASTAANTTTDAATTTSTTAAKPWYEGKADAETIGHWENRGLKKDDAGDIAVKMTQAYRHLEKKIGEISGVPPDRLLALPKDANDTAGWGEINKRLGVPADAKEYDFTGLKSADGREVEPAYFDTLRGALHEAGVRKDAARGIAEKMIKYADTVEAADSSDKQANLIKYEKDLSDLWGPNVAINKLRAMEGAKRLGISPEAVNLLEGEIGSANLMEAMRKIGVGTTEDTWRDGNEGGSSPATRNGAIARKVELESDKAWVKRYLAGDAKARQEMESLNMLITGEAA